MQHFIDIQSLSLEEINHLIQRALYFKHADATLPKYAGYHVAQLFYENSTRTRVSFALAAQRLEMHGIQLDIQHSSQSKGETILDTLQNLAAMGIQLFVLRHPQERLPEQLAPQLPPGTHLVNAGDGMHAHPSQALLDMMTILEEKSSLNQLKIALLGDLRHSRVANSLQSACAKLGVKQLALIAPTEWQPKAVHFGTVTSSVAEGLADADVVFCLRVQRERLLAAEEFDLVTYRRDYALTASRLLLAKKDAMVMHPGPVNRDVEMDSEIVNCPQSFILKQVENGVFMRMAILEALIHPQ